jgi:hypothetical protein
MLDKRINTEVSRMKKDLDSTLQSFKDDVRHDVNELESKVQQLSQTIPPNHYPTSDKQLKIIIRGLTFHTGENLNMKVNNLIKKGLLINNVAVLSTERKTANNTNTVGVVIANFQSVDDVKAILSAKSKLKDSQQYEDVFIHKDHTLEERSMNRNMKTLVNALRRKGCNISYQGNRVVANENDNQNNFNRGNRYNSARNDRRDYDRNDRRDYSFSHGDRPRSESDNKHGKESVNRNYYNENRKNDRQVKGQSQERMNVIKIGATNLNNPDPVAVAIRYPQVFGTLGGGI